MGDRSRPLLTATIATFDVVVLVLVGVIAGHASGALSELLQGLNTVVGVVVFLYLWLLALGATWWALGHVSLEGTPAGTLVAYAFGAGGVVGLAFLLGILAVLVVPELVTASIDPVSVVLFVAIGGGVATVVGAVIGLLLGLVDLLAYRAAVRLLPSGAMAPERR